MGGVRGGTGGGTGGDGTRGGAGGVVGGGIGGDGGDSRHEKPKLRVRCGLTQVGSRHSFESI